MISLILEDWDDQYILELLGHGLERPALVYEIVQLVEQFFSSVLVDLRWDAIDSWGLVVFGLL